MVAGSSLNVVATVSGSGGFNSPVNFGLTGLPVGASYGFSPATVSGSGTCR